MKFKRASGILMHPTSLPGKYGIGDLGPEAMRWIDFVDSTGCGLWQVLPLGPTGYGDSPYQCFSAFAGNPYLISPDLLLADGVLQPEDLSDAPAFPAEKVDFGWVISWKVALLEKAYERYAANPPAALIKEIKAFRKENAAWLEDFALFMALKDAHYGAPWSTWEAPLRDHQPAAINQARQEHADVIERQVFRQFFFFRQWNAVRSYAHAKDIQIVGDIPIFVAHDSADVWANTELFYMDQEGKPTVVAGVPPDYFSPTGQLWGNPLYRWDIHKSTGYAWWIARVKAVLGMVDIIRMDHFRGFAAYWEVSGDAKTAEKGVWTPGPGIDLFETLRSALGDLPLIAEDLGLITPDVVVLRDHFDLPGMKILQFAFGSDATEPFLPHNYTQNCVVYTGTHDNDTVKGWYERVPEVERDFYRRYLGRDGRDVAWDMIRGCWSSVAGMALAPMQDLLSLDNRARMNYPGNPSGNWAWRMSVGDANASLAKRLHEFNTMYLRLKDTPESKA